MSDNDMGSHNFLSFNDCISLESGYLITVNLQHLYECQKNKDLRDAVFCSKNARLCIDGRGAQIIFERWFGRKLPRAVGNEVLEKKLRTLDKARVLVVGTNKEVMEGVRRKYPAVDFTHDASKIQVFDRESAKSVASSLNEHYGSNFSFVALALGVPKQELLARELNKYIPAAPVFCIGGSFEMLSGQINRAPVLAQRLGIEGVWRFLVQPNRDRFLRVLNSYWNFICFITNQRQMHEILGTKDNEEIKK